MALAAVSTHKNEEKLNMLRKLDSGVHSVSLETSKFWPSFIIPSEADISNRSSLPNYWVLSISSNETVMSDEACRIFVSTLSGSDYNEDKSSVYSIRNSFFFSNNATRISLKAKEIIIANGAWKMNSLIMYMHDCESISKRATLGTTIGLIGLGLGSEASQNFQMRNPIFSIIIHSQVTGKLLFDIDTKHIRDIDTGISLPCDLNWKMQVSSLSIENLVISTNPVTMMFDLQNSAIYLPPVYYHSLRGHFFQMQAFIACQDTPLNYFWCIFLEKTDLPSFIFTLEDGTQFTLPPQVYVDNSDANLVE